MAFMESINKFLKFWYYQYILHTGLYMLDIWERRVFTSLLVAFIAMASYTGYIYLPGHLAMLQQFLRVTVLRERPEADTLDTAGPNSSEGILNASPSS